MPWWVCPVDGVRFQAWRPTNGKVRLCSRQCVLIRRSSLPSTKAAHRLRRALKSGALGGVRFEAEDIFDRDGWVCALCGKRVDDGLGGADRLGPTIDHIIPLSAGGRHHPLNVQLAHRLCNMRKGANGVGQLRLIA